MRSGYQVANPRGSEVREKRLAPGAGDPVRNGNAGARLDLHPVECTSRSALTLPVQTRLIARSSLFSVPLLLELPVGLPAGACLVVVVNESFQSHRGHQICRLK